MFCRQCGKNLNQNAVICPGCGCAASGHTAQNAAAAVPMPDDSGGIGWFFVGFLTGLVTGYILPIVLILIWKDQYPLRTKAILKGLIAEIIFTLAAVLAVVAVIVLIVVFAIVAEFGAVIPTAILF